MKRMALVCIAVSTVALLALDRSSAATIPSGTALVVRTLHGISSRDVPGTPFPAQLEKNVVVNGNVALPAGTKVSGKIETSKLTHHSSERLTVNITELLVGGRTVPVKTTGAVRLENENFKTRRGISVSRDSYQVAAGNRMEFRLAQPLKF